MRNEKDEAKTSWLESQKMPTKRYYKDWFAKFEEFTKMTGDEILADFKTRPVGYWEAKIVAFKTWLATEKNLSENTASASAMAARSFFAFHRIPLQFRTPEKRRLRERSRVTEDFHFNLEDIKRLSEVADLEEKYILVTGKSFGLRAGDFLKLTRSNLETHINDEPPISIGRIETVKERVPSYPFIDIDAKDVIKTILAKIATDGRTKPTDRILLFKCEIELTRALKRLAKRAGLNTGSQIVRFHCLRKFLSDHLASHMSESKWKQIVGKKISEGAYIGTESLREDYKRAMAETCFGQNFGDLEKRLKEVEEIKKYLGPDMLKRMQDAGIRLRRKGKECEDGEHCEAQQIVEEENLAGFLRENWKVTAVLPSGKIVVQRA
jgi:integrase